MSILPERAAPAAWEINCECRLRAITFLPIRSSPAFNVDTAPIFRAARGLAGKIDVYERPLPIAR